MGRAMDLPAIIRAKFCPVDSFFDAMRNRALVGECRYRGTQRAGEERGRGAPFRGGDDSMANWRGDDFTAKLVGKVALFARSRDPSLLPDIANYAAFLWSWDDRAGAPLPDDDGAEARALRQWSGVVAKALLRMIRSASR